MFEFSGTAPRAGLETLAGCIRLAGRTLKTPGLDSWCRYDIITRKTNQLWVLFGYVHL